MSDEHYRRLERMYLGARVNEYFRPRISIAKERAEIAIDVRDDFHHAAHAMHGTVYFKALDDATFFAVASIVEDVFVLTVNFNIVLLRPVADGTVTASGRVVHRSKNLYVAEGELVTERGKVAARGTGTFMRSTVMLDERVGYQVG